MLKLLYYIIYCMKKNCKYCMLSERFQVGCICDILQLGGNLVAAHFL